MHLTLPLHGTLHYAVYHKTRSNQLLQQRLINLDFNKSLDSYQISSSKLTFIILISLHLMNATSYSNLSVLFISVQSYELGWFKSKIHFLVVSHC